MKNKITLQEIKVNKNRVDYIFTVEGDWKKYFLDKPFYIEYEENIEEVPKSILVIPFIGDVLPMSWVFDATIVVDEVDDSFFHCLEEVKKGYIQMYPQISFLGDIQTNKVIKNQYKHTTNKNLVFFSGGLDAYSTLVSHIQEEPVLFTLWGADIQVTDEKRWNNIGKWIKQEAKEQGLKDIVARTSFREIIHDAEIDKYIKPKAKDGWWHGFHHGVGIITHAAPICYLYSSNKAYIASSYTAECHDVCASDPTIDNYIKMAETSVVHDGYEFNQGDKIKNVGEYIKKTKKKVKLRVCLSPDSIENCCACEKCYRRIMDIIAQGYDPNQLGFNCNAQTYKKMYHDFKYKIILRHTKHWRRIQNEFRKNREKYQNDERVSWILDFDFDKYNATWIKQINRYKKGLLRRMKKVRNKA